MFEAKGLPSAGKISFYLALIALAIFLLIQAYQLPAIRVAEHGVTPGFFPQAILWLFLITMIWVIVQDVLAARRDLPTATGEAGRPAFNWLRLACLGAVSAVLVLYILVMEAWGYLISTFLFLFLTTMILVWFFDRKRAATETPANLPKESLKAVVLAFVSSGVIYLVFTQVFNLVLP